MIFFLVPRKRIQHIVWDEPSSSVAASAGQAATQNAPSPSQPQPTATQRFRQGPWGGAATVPTGSVRGQPPYRSRPLQQTGTSRGTPRNVAKRGGAATGTGNVARGGTAVRSRGVRGPRGRRGGTNPPQHFQ